MTEVAFYYSIGSRYSYLAASQLATLKEETGCTIDWLPLNSVRLLAERGTSPFRGGPVSGQYEWSYRTRDAERWAALYGIPFVESRGRVEFDSELLAIACTAAKRLGKIEAVSQALFAALFDGSTSLLDVHECVRRAESCGIPSAKFLAEMESPGTRKELEHAMRSALRAGVFGVPAFVIDRELYWGNDRIVLLKQHLLRKREQVR
ncbi:MAG TPA: DsbA family protein [Polyangiaceae bacterium]|jgi:2-hydroxychromene-2-carboxylate isomerase|nr:DsbA family protein [Polyangiaceae bacterium]